METNEKVFYNGEVLTEADFKAYLHVQKTGSYNMLSSDARALTGLSKNKYQGVMHHYETLRRLYPETYKAYFPGR